MIRPLRSITLALLLCTACEQVSTNQEPLATVIYGEATTSPLLPFPSDRYTVADSSTRTGRRVVLNADATGDAMFDDLPGTAARLSEMDGFSTAGGIAVGFSAPVDGSEFAQPNAEPPFSGIDPARFTNATSPILLVVTDPDSPDLGKAIGLLPRVFEQAQDQTFIEDEFTVVARPAEPLDPGTEYSFVVTKRIKDQQGRPFARSEETERLLKDDASDYGKQVRRGVGVITSTFGLAEDDIVAASSFTTASVATDLIEAAAAERSKPAPLTVEPWTVETPLGADGRVRFRSTFRSEEFRDENGVFRFYDGLPVAQKEVDLEVFLAIADAEQDWPRPVVIYQHGLAGDKDGCWGTAQRLAELGVAVIAIDSPEHGSRGNGTGDALDSILGFFGVDEATLEFDVGRARDNFRQMTLDQLSLIRFMQTQADLDILPLGAPDGKPDLDVSRFLYVGHSFGAVQGSAIFAVAPEIEHAVWNVGGDGMMFLLEDSPLFSLFVDTLRPPGTSDGRLARFLAATQAIVDPGDGLTYARYALQAPLPGTEAVKPRNVLLQQVIDDGIVPNTSTEALARAAGLTLLNPVRPFPGATIDENIQSSPQANGSTGIMTQFATMNGGEVATHGELIFAPEARAQYVEFFRTGIVNGTATVKHP